MKKTAAQFIASALLASTSTCMANATVDNDGATPGKWTMDLTAAKTLAAEKELPILLDFSGSDWCGWCKIMEKNVFTQPEWEAYAKENLVMVLIDFPSDKSLVPEKYAARNDELQQQFGIEGFPTFVVLDDDGTTELGRLGSGQDKTPSSFRAELEALFRNRPATLARFAATLSPDDQAAFKTLTSKIAEQKQSIKKEEAVMEAVTQRMEELSASISQLEEELQGFRIKQLPEAQQKEYADLKAQFETKQAELMAWIGTQPERNDENMAKFQSMQTIIQDIAMKLEAY
jgi:protein disulfide-isomerase